MSNRLDPDKARCPVSPDLGPNYLKRLSAVNTSRQSVKFRRVFTKNTLKYEPVHEISNNEVCATSKASDQPAHTRSLIRAFASRLSII